MNIQIFARKAHRWLAYVVAVQVVIWVVGGVLFAWLPFQLKGQGG